MIVIEEQDFATAYSELLHKTYYHPEFITSPRNMLCHEHMNVILKINNTKECLYYNNVRSSQLKYISAELLWYFSGSDSTIDIEPHAPFWKSIENENGTVNSAYGARLFKDKNEFGITEWEWALRSLINDRDTRQAIMRINKPEHSHSDNKDFPCTLTITFHIREDKLNMTVHMRSNDIILGLPTDFAFFSVLQAQMLEHLHQNSVYAELGSYTHIVDSMHLYERNFDVAKKMLTQQFTSKTLFDQNIQLIDIDGAMTSTFSDMHKSFETKTKINEFDAASPILHTFIKNNYNTWVESRT